MALSDSTFAAIAALIGIATFAFTSDIAARSGNGSPASCSSSSRVKRRNSGVVDLAIFTSPPFRLAGTSLSTLASFDFFYCSARVLFDPHSLARCGRTPPPLLAYVHHDSLIHPYPDVHARLLGPISNVAHGILKSPF